MRPLPPPPVPPTPLPAALVDPDRSGLRPAVLLGSITFALFLLVVWLSPDSGCRARSCEGASTALIAALIAEPIVATVVASVRAGRATRRVAMGARALIAAAISLSFVGGILVGEWFRGAGDTGPDVVLIIPIAAAFLWPVPFVVSTCTSWALEGRRSLHRV